MQIPCSCGKTERPREPLLYPGIEQLGILCRIGGSLGTPGASSEGGNLEIPPWIFGCSHRRSHSTGHGTMSGGQFDWGGRLPKSNGGARRYPQAEWKPAVECKGIRVPDCKTDMSRRRESGS